jgi:hypothetical protein
MAKIDLTSWNKFFVRYVEPLFSQGQKLEDYYDFLKRVKPDFYPKNSVAQKFYRKIETDSRFDEELKKYFAFLYSCGFFMEYIITFDEWLEMKTWQNPIQVDEEGETILEILKMPNGSSLLKEKLRWIPFIDRKDGF